MQRTCALLGVEDRRAPRRAAAIRGPHQGLRLRHDPLHLSLVAVAGQRAEQSLVLGRGAQAGGSFNFAGAHDPAIDAMIAGAARGEDARRLRHRGAGARPRAHLRLLPDPALLRAGGLVGALDARRAPGDDLPLRRRADDVVGEAVSAARSASRSPSTSSPTSSAPGASSASGGWRRRSRRPACPLSISWRPYQLDADHPARGQGPPRLHGGEIRVGGTDQGDRTQHVAALGRGEGIPFAFDRIKVSPNTLDAHRLIRWAGEAGRQDDDRRGAVPRLFHRRAQYRRPRPCSPTSPPRTAWTATTSPHASPRTRIARACSAEIEAAQRIGVTGVPTFILAGRYGLVGAQPAEEIASALKAIAARRQAQATAAE